VPVIIHVQCRSVHLLRLSLCSVDAFSSRFHRTDDRVCVVHATRNVNLKKKLQCVDES
jgi:hypothetical protein